MAQAAHSSNPVAAYALLVATENWKVTFPTREGLDTALLAMERDGLLDDTRGNDRFALALDGRDDEITRLVLEEYIAGIRGTVDVSAVPRGAYNRFGSL